MQEIVLNSYGKSKILLGEKIYDLAPSLSNRLRVPWSWVSSGHHFSLPTIHRRDLCFLINGVARKLTLQYFLVISGRQLNDLQTPL